MYHTRCKLILTFGSFYMDQKTHSNLPGFGWAVLTTSLAFVVAQLDVSIVNIALPEIAKAYHAGISTLQWVIDAYTLAFAVLMLSAGSLGDLLGSKKIFQIGMIIFGIASAGCGLAPDAITLIICRVAQGIGAAMMIPSSLALLNHQFAHTPQTRTRAVGLWTAAGSAAMAAGPTIGGFLIAFSSWRFIFIVNIPICIIGYILSFKMAQMTKTSKRSFDLPGQLTWMLSVTTLISVIIEIPRLGLGHVLIWGGLILSLLIFGLFLWIEGKTAHPMLPFHLFKSARFNALLILGAVLNGSYYGSVFILSLYLQKVLNYPSIMAGLAFLPLTVGFVISNVISGRIVNRYGIRKPIIVGLIMFAAGFAGLFIAHEHTPYLELFLPFLVIPMGMGLAVPAMTNGILSSVDKTLSGTASAILNTARQTAGAIGVAVFGAMAAGGTLAILGAVSKSAAISIGLTAFAMLLIVKGLKR
ncbi:MFS transporter [Mucilaginibacter sp. 3215]|uniref:MFS transporter n=1 Tax=Mucilaginibacter sp. 3215 TaxID=3373912 RepID=UPI003D23148D